ncbi:hypothetical protein LQZ18_10005 [Lachnospiraceae bacterium ZAX-1]
MSRYYTDEFKEKIVTLHKSGRVVTKLVEGYGIAKLLWSSFFVTLLANKI